MVRTSRTFTEVIITPALLVAISISLILIPLRYLMSWLCAVIIHELGHYIALRCLNVPIISVTVDVKGIKILTGEMQLHEELLCAGAGPIGSLLLLLFIEWLPVIAVCGGVQGAFNLLPIFPFDGGRMIRAAAKICFSDRREGIVKVVCIWILILMGLITVCITVLKRI